MVESILSGSLQAHNTPSVLENLQPVGVINLVSDLLLHTDFDVVTAKKVDGYEEVQQVGERDQD